MNRNRYWEVTQSDWCEMAQVVIAFIALTVILAVFLLSSYWYLWLVIVVEGLALLVVWHAKKFAYLCPGCGKVFVVSTLEDFISPNGVNKKYLKCPRCRKRTWADILRIKEGTVLKK